MVCHSGSILIFPSNRSFQNTVWKIFLNDHVSISRELIKKIKPLQHFKKYLQTGFYPYFIENENSYLQKLGETIGIALSTDLPAAYGISYSSVEKMRQLLYIIAEAVPFTPNITKLSERIGISRNSFLQFLQYLDEMRIIKKLFASTKGIGLLQKPEKIYLQNTNLHFALSPIESDIGNMRECFFLNQAGAVKPVVYTKKGDFKIDKYTFEIGGKDKSNMQVAQVPFSYVVADGIETGYKTTSRCGCLASCTDSFSNPKFTFV